MSGDHNQYQKPDKQCDRCGEVNPAEIHTCTPKQEPVAWWNGSYSDPRFSAKKNAPGIGVEGVPLYTAPPQREWQGLTEYEVGFLTVFDGLHDVEVPLLANFIRHIEAKLKEKNT